MWLSVSVLPPDRQLLENKSHTAVSFIYPVRSQGPGNICWMKERMKDCLNFQVLQGFEIPKLLPLALETLSPLISLFSHCLSPFLFSLFVFWIKHKVPIFLTAFLIHFSDDSMGFQVRHRKELKALLGDHRFTIKPLGESRSLFCAELQSALRMGARAAAGHRNIVILLLPFRSATPGFS